MTAVLGSPPSLDARTRTRSRPLTQRIVFSSLAVAAGTAWVVWEGASFLERNGRLGTTLAGGWGTLAAPLVIGVVGTMLVCEHLWPAEQRTPLARGRVHDAWYFGLHLAAVIPLMTMLSVAFAFLLGGLSQWIGPTWSASIPAWVVVPVILILMDGCNWLAHWADHHVEALWRMHALHHSQKEVNVLTSFRAHPLSHFMGFFLATIPVVVLLGNRTMAPLLITVYVCLSTVSHANVPWSFGPVGRLMVSPAYHRLHHDIDDRRGVNLGVVLTVWDVVARRAVFPRPGLTCQTGIRDTSVPCEQSPTASTHLAVVFSQLIEPFVGRSAAPGAGDR